MSVPWQILPEELLFKSSQELMASITSFEYNFFLSFFRIIGKYYWNQSIANMQIHDAAILILLLKSFVEIKVANFTLYNTLKLRFARFAEDVKLSEQECLQCWNVQIKGTGVHVILHFVCAFVIYAGLIILITILKLYFFQFSSLQNWTEIQRNFVKAARIYI